ncbi:MAG: class I SAM-dependent DNA methyltransferase [Solirubrobacteraceae bacterium]
MSYLETTDPARSAYATLAPFYDRFTAGYAHDRWLGQIESRALGLGLAGRRVLDIGCGTGKSFAPLLDRGYSVTACDISPEMVDEALQKFGDQVDDLLVGDMRDLPPLGEFDLVTCLNDAINYLLDPRELEAAFRSVADVLAPRGVYVFDVTSLGSYRSTFSRTILREDAGGLFCWHGEGTATMAAGDAVSARIEAFIEAEDELWQRVSSRHVQRHHPPTVIRAALHAAGLECAATAGQRPGGNLDDHADEREHIKVVYFARLRRMEEGVSFT